MRARPSYSLVTRVLTPAVDPGARLEFEVYLSGHGELEQNKLAIYYPPGLVNRHDSGHYVFRKTAGIEGDSSGGRHRMRRRRIAPPIDVLQLEVESFSPVKGTSIVQSEVRGDKKGPPLLVRANVSPECPPGEHPIVLVFSYFDGAEWRTARDVVKVAVRGLLARHMWLPVAAVVAAAMAAVLILVISLLASFGAIP